MSAEAAEKFFRLTPLLDPSFGIPSDVRFEIIGYQDGEDQETSLGSIKAHKTALALASPVFKAEFFGPSKETKDIIPVRETTLKSFQQMVDFIYGKKIELKDISVFEIFDIANLAEKYQIPELSEELTFQLRKYPLTMDNVLDVAITAEQFNQFEAIVTLLLETCAKFLKSKLKTPDSQIQFVLQQSGTGKEKIVLHLLSMASRECSNCKQSKCVNGQLITTCESVARGMEVKIANVTDPWYGKTATVANVYPETNRFDFFPPKNSTMMSEPLSEDHFEFKCD